MGRQGKRACHSLRGMGDAGTCLIQSEIWENFWQIGKCFAYHCYWLFQSVTHFAYPVIYQVDSLTPVGIPDKLRGYAKGCLTNHAVFLISNVSYGFVTAAFVLHGIAHNVPVFFFRYITNFCLF
jgi:hypothetical protein